MSLNTYNFGTFKVGGYHTVWCSTLEKYPVGGFLDMDKYPTRPTKIPAGSMVYLSHAGGEAIIVKSTDTDLLDKVNGLTQNDIDLGANTTQATVTVVVKGQIYADYINEVPLSVQKQLSGITFVNLVKPIEAPEGGGGE